MKFTTILSFAALCLLSSIISGVQAADLPTVSAEAEPLPVAVPPNDPALRYIGRFTEEGAAGPRCSWSGSAIALRFTGDRLNVRLNDSSNSDEYEIVIDGMPAGILTPQAGSNRYAVYPVAAAGTKGPHTVILCRRTEAFFGTTRFEGFEISQGGRLLSPPAAAPHRIEVIGDSISCGYGNEAPNEKEHFRANTENAYLAYGAVAARAMNAEYTCIAWSGRLMWPTNTIPDIYDQILPTAPGSLWDFTRGVPDAVVINLGTNDMNAKVRPDEKGWITNYEAFIVRVRKNYPHAAIYCATSPMLAGEKDTTERKWLHQIVQDENAAGDANVRFLDFKTQSMADGLGADWHPNIKTHEIMAKKLEATLQSDMKWKPVAAP